MNEIKKLSKSINWVLIGMIFLLANAIAFFDDHLYLNYNIGTAVFVLLIMIYAKVDAKMKKQERMIKQKNQRKDVIDFLGKMCYEDRLEILKEVQEKTKGE